MKAPEVSEAAARRLLDGVHDGPDPQGALARAIWSVLIEPGDSTAGALLCAHGPVDALRRALEDVDDDLGEARARWLPRYHEGIADAAVGAARRAGVELLVPGDAGWPSRLADLSTHAPVALWTRGRPVGHPPQPTVAVVGARAATAYGEGVAADLAAELASAGIMVVSGAAYGIDGAAHRAALSAGGTTLAFLAGGVDRAYPRGHEALLGRIAAAGAVWSEVPCGTAPTKWRFLSRNRLIAAMADAVVVVEAGWRSGSLNTAAHAATLGRPLGAVPGPVTSPASAGCHRILRDFSGVCVTSAADVREMLGVGPEAPGLLDLATDDRSETGPTGGRTDETTRVCDALSRRISRTAEDVAARSGLTIDRTRALLGMAALRGLVARDADGSWRREG